MRTLILAIGVMALIAALYALSQQIMPRRDAAVRAEPAVVGNDSDIAIEPAPRPAAAAASSEPMPPPIDGRLPGQWHYVPRLGDGPGALYSRNGGPWNYAFACTRQARTIEIIAVGTGDPGSFDKQSITAGKMVLMMNASYARDNGGTISTTLPADHIFFTALEGAGSMEMRLLAGGASAVPVGPAVVRLIRLCRGRG